MIDLDFDAKFELWWFGVGSGITPNEGEDAEEHAKRVAELAYANGVIDGAKAYGTGRTEPND